MTKNLYIVTSNPGGLYGADRVKDDLSVSLIALNSKTGLKQWHFQHIRHDLWDFDLVGNPIIFSTKKDNQLIRVFDRIYKNQFFFQTHQQVVLFFQIANYSHTSRPSLHAYHLKVFAFTQSTLVYF